MRAGFVAADEEAAELLAAPGDLEAMVARRLTGEPLAWITGTAPFCGLWMRVDAGVYVPRWQTEALAWRAVERLPADGVAIDLCTGSGAIAKVLMTRAGPGARVVASDVDPAAVACARSNGVEAYVGDLFEPLPDVVADVIVGVVAIRPDTGSAAAAARHVHVRDATGLRRRHRRARHRPAGHRRGAEAPASGSLLLELGGDQAAAFDAVEEILDEEGDVRGIELRS